MSYYYRTTVICFPPLYVLFYFALQSPYPWKNFQSIPLKKRPGAAVTATATSATTTTTTTIAGAARAPPRCTGLPPLLSPPLRPLPRPPIPRWRSPPFPPLPPRPDPRPRPRPHALPMPVHTAITPAPLLMNPTGGPSIFLPRQQHTSGWTSRTPNVPQF